MSEPLSTRVNKALVYIANKVKSLYSVTDNLSTVTSNLDSRTTQNETSISDLQDSKIDCNGGGVPTLLWKTLF